MTLGSSYINCFCDSYARLKWWAADFHSNFIQKMKVTCIFLAVYIALWCACPSGIHCRISVCFCMNMAKFNPCLSPIVLRDKKAYLEMKSFLSLSQNSLQNQFCDFFFLVCSSNQGLHVEIISLSGNNIFASMYAFLTNYLTENLIDIFHPQPRCKCLLHRWWWRSYLSYCSNLLWFRIFNSLLWLVTVTCHSTLLHTVA